MTTLISDDDTSNIADKKTKKNKQNTPNVKKNFALMLVEFNVIPYVVGFGIALTIQNFLFKLGEYIIIKLFHVKNDLLISFLVMILMIIFCYILIYFVFFRFIYTPDISRETVIKQAITEKKKDEVKKDISQDKEIKQKIEKDIYVIPEEKLIEEYKYYI